MLTADRLPKRKQCGHVAAAGCGPAKTRLAGNILALRLLMLFELAADDHDLAFALDDSALVAHGFD